MSRETCATEVVLWRASIAAVALAFALSCAEGPPDSTRAGADAAGPEAVFPAPAAENRESSNCPTAAREVPGGRLRELGERPSSARGLRDRAGRLRVLELWGSPEEMGRAHGELLGPVVRRVLDEVVYPERWRRIRDAVEIMERFQPERFRRELAALAGAAGVEYMRLVALQLFGDAERVATVPGWQEPSPTDDLPPGRPPSQGCTFYAVFGPATRTGECIVGRNFDYWPESVAREASTIIHYRPEGERSFVTLTWAGVVNGWTLMNEAGLCAANNSVVGQNESLEGISTCFLQRYVIERAGTVEEGIALARSAPRAIGTAMLLAGGTPPDAAVLEFDHESLVARRARAGYVLAANSLRALGRDSPLEDDEGEGGRYGALLRLVRANYGRIDRTMNFAAASGVPIEEINLHCAVLFPADRSFVVSMGTVPACRGSFRRFRMTPTGLEHLD